MTNASSRSGPSAVWPAALLAALLVLPTFAGSAAAAPAPSPLRPDSGSILGVLDSLHASILTIVAVPEPPAGATRGKRKRLIGTGVAADERLIVTTASLAFPGRGAVRVLLGGGNERVAVLRGVDRQSNLAIFQIDEPLLHSLRRAPPQSLAVGAWVAVISNIGIRPQAALGRVTGRGERVDFPYSGDILEIDAPSYPGSAGGAVVNEDGEWVAVVVGRGHEPPRSGERVGVPKALEPASGGVLLAVPVDQVDRIARDLLEHGVVQRGFLGIRLKRGPIAPGDTLGVHVEGVVPDSPAARAGIRRGDRILAFEGQELRTPDDLSLLVGALRPGEETELTLLRDAEILPIRVVLGPPPGPEGPLGR